MNFTRPILGLAMAVVVAGSVPTAHAGLVTRTYSSGFVGATIPDGQPTFTPFLRTVSGSGIQSLTRVEITLDLAGSPVGAGFAHDMVANLLLSPLGIVPDADDPAAVLFNRVDGLYGGWSITLSDDAAEDVHTVLLDDEGPLTGVYQPDGRLDPENPVRGALLSVFDGLSGDGDWRLNLADVDAFGVMQLNGWTLTLTGEDGLGAAVVPEAGSWLAVAGFGLGLALQGMARRRRRR